MKYVKYVLEVGVVYEHFNGLAVTQQTCYTKPNLCKSRNDLWNGRVLRKYVYFFINPLTKLQEQLHSIHVLTYIASSY